MNIFTFVLLIIIGLAALFVVSWFEAIDDIKDERIEAFKNKKGGKRK